MDDFLDFRDSTGYPSTPDLGRERPVTGAACAQLVDLALSPHERALGVVMFAVLDADRRPGELIVLPGVPDAALGEPAPPGLVEIADDAWAAGGWVIFARGRAGQPYLTPSDLAWLEYAETTFGDRLAGAFLATPDLVRSLRPAERFEVA